MVIMVLAFFVAGELAFNLHSKDPRIDVFMFQANASWALTHGLNPYTFRYPSMYPPGTPYYGPGVVDANGILTVGFPYPPSQPVPGPPRLFLAETFDTRTLPPWAYPPA